MIVTLYLADCTVEVEGEYYPGCRGSYRDGLQQEPDSPDEFFLESYKLMYDDGRIIHMDELPVQLVDDRWEDYLTTACLETVGEQRANEVHEYYEGERDYD